MPRRPHPPPPHTTGRAVFPTPEPAADRGRRCGLVSTREGPQVHRPAAVRRRGRTRRRRPVGGAQLVDAQPPGRRLRHHRSPTTSVRYLRQRTADAAGEHGWPTPAAGGAHLPRRSRHPGATSPIRPAGLGARPARDRAADDQRVHRRAGVRRGGLLHDRPATTHWGSLELLGQLDPSITVRPDDRFVDDGDIITSCGVSAGIDMALHLVSRPGRAGSGARRLRRGIQYRSGTAGGKEL